MLYRSSPAWLTFLLVDSTGRKLQSTTPPVVTITRVIDAGQPAPATGTATPLGAGWYRYDLSPAETDCERVSYLIESPGALPQTRDLVFAARDFAGVPRGQPFPGFVFGMMTRDGLGPAEPGRPTVTVSNDGQPPRPVSSLPLYVGNGLYRIDLSASDLSGRCNYFSAAMPGAMPAHFVILTVA